MFDHIKKGVGVAGGGVVNKKMMEQGNHSMAGIGGPITSLQQRAVREYQTSEDESGSIGSAKKRTRVEGSLSLDVSRKPRGRPPGSKNKAKPPLIITRDSESTMKPHVLEIPDGCDIVQCLMSFSQKHQVGICVLSARGAVASVSLRQGGTVTLHGRFELLSLSGAYLPPSSQAVSAGGLSISLAGPQGQVVGGTVGDFLSTAGPVVIVVASFVNPSYHNLNSGEEEENGNDNGNIAPPPPPHLPLGNGYSPLPGSSGIYNISPTAINSGQISPPDGLPWTGNGRPSYSIH